jgi:hypothetical protein
MLTRHPDAACVEADVVDNIDVRRQQQLHAITRFDKKVGKD